jgi:hypothetical protein
VWGVHRRNKAEQHMWYIKLQSFTYHNMSQVNNLYIICSYANRLEIETNDSRQVYVHIQSLYVTIYIFLKKKVYPFWKYSMYHHVSSCIIKKYINISSFHIWRNVMKCQHTAFTFCSPCSPHPRNGSLLSQASAACERKLGIHRGEVMVKMVVSPATSGTLTW